MATSCKEAGCNGHVTSAHVNLQIDNNGTWQDGFQFGKPGDISWTLAGQSFSLEVQRNRYDTVPLLSMSTTDGKIIVDDIVQRVIHFNVDPVEIKATLSPGTYVYDLLMLSDTGIYTPLMHGNLQVCQGVTG